MKKTKAKAAPRVWVIRFLDGTQCLAMDRANAIDNKSAPDVYEVVEYVRVDAPKKRAGAK